MTLCYVIKAPLCQPPCQHCRQEQIHVFHYGDVILSAIAAQITCVSIVYSTVCSSADQRKHRNSASLAFVRGFCLPYPGCRWVHLTKRSTFLCGSKFFALNIFCGEYLDRVYIWCCKYGENRYCERCANKKLCSSKHTGLLNSCLGKLCLHPYLVVPLISARVSLISTRVQPIVRPSYSS